MTGILIVSGRRTLGQFEGGERSAQAGRRLVSAFPLRNAEADSSLPILSAIFAVGLCRVLRRCTKVGERRNAVKSASLISALEFSKTPTSPRDFYDRRYRDCLKDFRLR